jgi:hypothetical protein
MIDHENAAIPNADQSVAKCILDARRSRCAISFLLRKQRKHYLVLLAISSLTLGYLAVAATMAQGQAAVSLLTCAIGFMSGIFLQEVRWLLTIRVNWPLFESLADWNKVAAIAANEATEN